jgi:pantothenate synthetase
VPCVRMRETGAPVSSRLRFLPPERLREVGAVYDMLELGRRMVASGEGSSETLLATLQIHIAPALKTFDLVYLTVVDAATFGPIEQISLPFILHCAISDGMLTHFDGLCIQSEDDLQSGPDVIWLDHPRPM